MLRLFAALTAITLISSAVAIVTASLIFRAAAVLLGLVVIALYVWLQRSLGARSGFVRLPGLTEPVEVFRDERGAAHLFARTTRDLYLAQGFVTAQDRLWQMEVARRAATGRLSEIFGEALVPFDRHMRDIGLGRAAAASLQACGPGTVELLEAYADGVNSRIHEGRLPPEVTLVGLGPEPWSPSDSIAIWKFLSYHNSLGWVGDLFRARLVQTVGAQKASELFPQATDPEALTWLETAALPEVDSLLKFAAETIVDNIGGVGWVVAGSRSRSGAPLLASAPKAPITGAPLWYETHLVESGGMDVAGASYPGIPGVLIGQNREIAWSTAALQPDVQDLTLERVNPEAPEQYLVGDRWEPLTSTREEIRVRGQRTPLTHRVMRTRSGPVIARGSETLLTLRWTGLEPSAEIETFLGINRSRSWQDFRAALAGYQSPPRQFIFAARDGTIASKPAGTVPHRVGGDGQVPAAGWTDQFSWTGVRPPHELEEVVNPPKGYISAVGDDTMAGYQARRISSWLSGTASFTPERMQEVLNDQVNLHARTLIELLLHAVQEGILQGGQTETLNPQEKAVLLMLSGWDCTETAESPCPPVWHQWYQFLLEGIFRPQMGLELYDQFLNSGSSTQVADRIIQRVAEGSDSLWLDREGEGGLNRIALRAFRRAVALVGAKQGKQYERWRWDRDHRVEFHHLLTRGLPLLRSFLNVGPFPSGGSGATVWSHGYNPLQSFGVVVTAPWRQVVDLGDIEASRYICAPGLNGHPLSSHHADHAAVWIRGELVPRVLRHDAIRKLPRLLLHPSGSEKEAQGLGSGKDGG